MPLRCFSRVQDVFKHAPLQASRRVLWMHGDIVGWRGSPALPKNQCQGGGVDFPGVLPLPISSTPAPD